MTNENEFENEFPVNFNNHEIEFGDLKFSDWTRYTYIIINKTTQIICRETKSVDEVLEYLKIIRPQYPDCKYVVIGKFENVEYTNLKIPAVGFEDIQKWK